MLINIDKCRKMLYNGKKVLEVVAMYNVEKKLNYLRCMKKGKIPEEYQKDGKPKKYSSVYEQYKAMYDLLDACEKDERDCIEVSLISGSRIYKDLREYMGIVSVFLSSVTLIISSMSVFWDKLLDGKSDTIIKDSMQVILGGTMFMVLIALFSYIFLHRVSGNGSINMYILEILKKVNEEKQQEKNICATQDMHEESGEERTYVITVKEKQSL